MILVFIFNEVHHAPAFLPKSIMVTAEIYQGTLRANVIWIDTIADGFLSVSQEDSDPAHKAKMTKPWMLENVPHHWTPDFRPVFAHDWNPLNYFLWFLMKAKTNKHVQYTVEFLNAAIVEKLATVDKNMVARAWKSFFPAMRRLLALVVDIYKKNVVCILKCSWIKYQRPTCNKILLLI